MGVGQGSLPRLLENQSVKEKTSDVQSTFLPGPKELRPRGLLRLQIICEEFLLTDLSVCLLVFEGRKLRFKETNLPPKALRQSKVCLSLGSSSSLPSFLDPCLLISRMRLTQDQSFSNISFQSGQNPFTAELLLVVPLIKKDKRSCLWCGRSGGGRLLPGAQGPLASHCHPSFAAGFGETAAQIVPSSSGKPESKRRVSDLSNIANMYRGRQSGTQQNKTKTKSFLTVQMERKVTSLSSLTCHSFPKSTEPCPLRDDLCVSQ